MTLCVVYCVESIQVYEYCRKSTVFLRYESFSELIKFITVHEPCVKISCAYAFKFFTAENKFILIFSASGDDEQCEYVADYKKKWKTETEHRVVVPLK